MVFIVVAVTTLKWSPVTSMVTSGLVLLMIAALMVPIPKRKRMACFIFEGLTLGVSVGETHTDGLQVGVEVVLADERVGTGNVHHFRDVSFPTFCLKS